MQLNVDWNAATAEEELQLKRQLESAKCRLQMLLQKQGRDAQFGSAEERDRWILSEIKELHGAADAKSNSIKQIRHSITQQEKQLSRYQATQPALLL